MEKTAFLWSYQENVDELNQKLLYTSLELEQLKIETGEETRKTNEYVKQLLQLVEFACIERDEARDQLQNLLNKLKLPSFQPDSPLMKATESNNSLSSPGDSFIDAAAVSSSPDFSSSNIVFDQASLVIDNIVKGKPLPEKGMFLKAVVDAGPLLQNLLVAGPLPQWRNPPQLEMSQIPPVPIKGCNVDVDVITNANFDEMSCFPQMLSTSVLNFRDGAYGSCLGSDNTYVQVSKRQRFH